MKNCLVKRGSHAKLDDLMAVLENSAAAFFALLELATGKEAIEQAKAICIPQRPELGKFQPTPLQLPDGPTCLCGEPEKEGGGSWVNCDSCGSWCVPQPSLSSPPPPRGSRHRLLTARPWRFKPPDSSLDC